jgi:curved DNA-binding protein CbpA
MRIGQAELDQDFYATLGIATSATATEIRRAHRRLVKRHHPDLASSARASTGKASAEAEMKRVNLAASVLLDPSARARYDALRARGAGQWPFAEEPHGSGAQPARAGAARGFPTGNDSSRQHRSPRPTPRFRRVTIGAMSIPPSLLAAALAATVLVGLLSWSLGSVKPVSSSDYRMNRVQRVTMWVD